MQNIFFKIKNRSLNIEQMEENKFLFTIKINNENLNSEIQASDDKLTQVIGQIELYPEDIIIIQKFINVRTLSN